VSCHPALPFLFTGERKKKKERGGKEEKTVYLYSSAVSGPSLSLHSPSYTSMPKSEKKGKEKKKRGKEGAEEGGWMMTPASVLQLPFLLHFFLLTGKKKEGGKRGRGGWSLKSWQTSEANVAELFEVSHLLYISHY